MATLVAVAVPALAPLAGHGGDPTAALRVGRFSASRSFIEQDFREPVLTEDTGHDGQPFYLPAATFPDLSASAELVE